MPALVLAVTVASATPPLVLVLAVKVAVATPLLLVVTVVVLVMLANMPLVSDRGAAEGTLALLMGLLNSSTTVACKAVAKAVLTVALCGVPAVGEMLGCAESRSEERRVGTGVGAPLVLAVTV